MALYRGPSPEEARAAEADVAEFPAVLRRAAIRDALAKARRGLVFGALTFGLVVLASMVAVNPVARRLALVVRAGSVLGLYLHVLHDGVTWLRRRWTTTGPVQPTM